MKKFGKVVLAEGRWDDLRGLVSPSTYRKVIHSTSSVPFYDWMGEIDFPRFCHWCSET